MKKKSGLAPRRQGRRAQLPCLLCVLCVFARNVRAAQTDAAPIRRGASIFATTCGIGYCHGKEGRAGRGPRLADKKWDRDYLQKTISEGVNNSLMPPFKNQLSPEDISAVVAYILSLSGDKIPSDTSPAPSAEPPKVQPKPADPNAGDPEAGRALFFDASNPKRCSACHQFRGRGTDAGPDLTAISARPAPEILQDIVDPDARLAVDPITVITKSGETIIGVKKQETRDSLRIYDTRSLPPVLHTLYKDQIQSIKPHRHSPMPADYSRLFTRKQLLDLVAFLKSAQ